MTTTLSMPKRLCERADKTAKTMGVSQEKLILLAVQKYLEVYENTNKQDDFDEVYSNYIPDRIVLDSSVTRVRELLKNDAW